MSMLQPAHGDDRGHGDAGLAADLNELRRALADLPFPSCQDDLIAACIARHEATRLACRLSRIPRERTYATLEDVLTDVAAAAVSPAAL